MKNSYSILLAFLLCQFMNAQVSEKKEIPLEIGKEYNGALSAQNAHLYTLNLDSAQFVHGFADQISVDVVITILDAGNKKVASFDGPGKGHENFQFVTKSSGTFKIEIKPFEKKEGSYTLRVSGSEKLAEEPTAKTDQLMTIPGKKFPELQ